MSPNAHKLSLKNPQVLQMEYWLVPLLVPTQSCFVNRCSYIKGKNNEYAIMHAVGVYQASPNRVQNAN